LPTCEQTWTDSFAIIINAYTQRRVCTQCHNHIHLHTEEGTVPCQSVRNNWTDSFASVSYANL